MAEYIDRDLTEQALMERCNETGYGGLNRTDVKMVMRTPWRIPNADVVERKHGRDICDTVKGHCEFKCSVCGAWIGCVEGGTLDGGKFKFCPNCGAIIESEGEDGNIM